MSSMEENAARLFVIAAPSGAGKTTLVRRLVERNPSLRFSISYTTRRKRKTEVEGRDYFFVSKAEFAALREQGELLESAIVFDNEYGTSRSQVEAHLAEGHHVILEIDWQGAELVRQALPGCTTIFVMPPSQVELERRLRSRATDSNAVIARRLADAMSDMSHWAEFDYVIINDRLEQAVGELEAIISGTGDRSLATSARIREVVSKVLA